MGGNRAKPQEAELAWKYFLTASTGFPPVAERRLLLDAASYLQVEMIDANNITTAASDQRIGCR